MNINTKELREFLEQENYVISEKDFIEIIKCYNSKENLIRTYDPEVWALNVGEGKCIPFLVKCVEIEDEKLKSYC